jgi:Gas vesicle synthesis protein GvpO
MAKTTERERRAAAREQRRTAKADEPTSERTAEDAEGDPADALRAAASAAIAGAAVGAARAFARRRHADEDGNGDEDRNGTDETQPVEEPEPEAVAEEPEADEPEEEQRAPVAAGDARQIVQRAREQLRELHGAEAESVSAVRRSADGWRVGLEVVEVHRIPDSTDVLATYEVELDRAGQLLTFERTSRYYRSEADRR